MEDFLRWFSAVIVSITITMMMLSPLKDAQTKMFSKVMTREELNETIVSTVGRALDNGRKDNGIVLYDWYSNQSIKFIDMVRWDDLEKTNKRLSLLADRLGLEFVDEKIGQEKLFLNKKGDPKCRR